MAAGRLHSLRQLKISVEGENSLKEQHDVDVREELRAILYTPAAAAARPQQPPEKAKQQLGTSSGFGSGRFGLLVCICVSRTGDACF